MSSFYEEKYEERKEDQGTTSQAVSSGELLKVERERDVHQLFHPIIKATKYVWNNFPPLSWFCYGLVALNAIPLTILIVFLAGTLIFVLSVTGTGILLAEGFFLGIGSLFFIPILVILTFSAISTTFFTVSCWSAYKVAIYALRYTGLITENRDLDALDRELDTLDLDLDNQDSENSKSQPKTRTNPTTSISDVFNDALNC